MRENPYMKINANGKPSGKKELRIGGYTFYYGKEQNLRHDNNNFIYQFRKYSADYFKKELLMELDKGIKKYRDEKGREVLSVYESIPTFDSCDREWNSYKQIYIVKKNGTFTGFYFTGGYHLADVKRYTHMECGDENTKNMLESMEMM